MATIRFPTKMVLQVLLFLYTCMYIHRYIHIYILIYKHVCVPFWEVHLESKMVGFRSSSSLLVDKKANELGTSTETSDIHALVEACGSGPKFGGCPVPVDEGTLRSNSFNFAPGRFSNYMGGFVGFLAEKLQFYEIYHHVISFPHVFMALFMAAEFSPFFQPRCMVKDISSSPEMARISISISMATTLRRQEMCELGTNWAVCH